MIVWHYRDGEGDIGKRKRTEEGEEGTPPEKRFVLPNKRFVLLNKRFVLLNRDGKGNLH